MYARALAGRAVHARERSQPSRPVNHYIGKIIAIQCTCECNALMAYIQSFVGWVLDVVSMVMRGSGFSHTGCGISIVTLFKTYGEEKSAENEKGRQLIYLTKKFGTDESVLSIDVSRKARVVTLYVQIEQLGQTQKCPVCGCFQFRVS